MFATALILGLVSLAGGSAQASAPRCDARARAAVLARAISPDDEVRLTCSLRLEPGDVVTKRLVLEGEAARGVDLDCAGGQIGRRDAPPTFPNAALEIRSAAVRSKAGETIWQAPSDITIRHCTILGALRIWGMGRNGQDAALRDSSHAPGHTERAQEAAPTRIAIEHAIIEGTGVIPVYVAPGVTEFSLTDSHVAGRSVSVALYLDAESARNVIERDTFDAEVGREVIAVDGSAHNRIADNTIRTAWRGGIFLYRNCGEGGTVRHQSPSSNTITGNRVSFSWPVHLPGILVGSRHGFSRFCHEDDGYPFGSSANNDDDATDNVVRDNMVE